MAIIGTHALLYSSEPDELRRVLRDAFGFSHIDSGGGWLIFALPPAELGVHPTEGDADEPPVRHQLTFMCDDLETTAQDLRAKGVVIEGTPEDAPWGRHLTLVLPGGVEVLLYQPKHQTAIGS